LARGCPPQEARLPVLQSGWRQALKDIAIFGGARTSFEPASQRPMNDTPFYPFFEKFSLRIFAE
jgi:hypothetical protein